MRFWFLLLIVASSSFALDDDSIRESRSIELSTSRHTTKLESEERITIGNQNGSGEQRRLIGGHLNNIQEENNDDDEAMEMESAGNGKSTTTLTPSSRRDHNDDDDDDERKTLSQQVADGHYGLIQKEIFSKSAEKENDGLGIISYKGNPDVPKDTIKNLGGLSADEIWLAEDHLLVLKGGIFSSNKNNLNWPPIDNYKAPRRQVKIPNNPKIPPPFPVQLTDNGPIELLGPNGTSKTLSKDINTIYPAEGFPPGTGPFFPPSSLSKEEENNDEPQPVYGIPAPIRTSGNFSKGNGPLQPFPRLPPPGLIGRLPPFLASLPPNAVYLPPPPLNQTDIYEEDDPSIYYPPPYTFYYSRDNTTGNIPAGPLVPGIILPPPPDFFGQLEVNNTSSIDKKNSTKIRIYTTTTQPSSTIEPETNRETLTSKPIFVPDTIEGPEKIPIIIPQISDIPDNSLNSITTPVPPRKIIKPYYTTERTKITNPKKTIIYPTKSNKVSGTYYEDSFIYNPIYGPPPARKTPNRIEISTTAVPLKAFFTTNNEIESNSVTNDPIAYFQGRHNNLAARASPKFPTNTEYYFYEEPKTTSERYNYQYFKTPTRTNSAAGVDRNNKNNQQPIYIPQNQYYSPEVINRQIIQLQNEIQSYLTSPKPVYQYSFQAANYVAKNLKSQQQQEQNDQYRPITGFDNPTTTVSPPPLPLYDTNAKQLESYDYEDTTNTPPIPVVKKITPSPLIYRKTIKQYHSENIKSTENPIDHAYYTRQEETLLDDITKQYFTVFGQKIGSRNHPPVTTPIQPIISTTTPLPDNVQVEVHFGDNTQGQYEDYTAGKPLRLDTDININERNPSTESPRLIETLKPIVNARRQQLTNYNRYDGRYQPNRYDNRKQKPPSLINDTLVNLQNPSTENPNLVETFQPIVVNPQQAANYNRNPQYEEHYEWTTKAPTLLYDTRVNERDPNRQPNPDAEQFTPIVVNLGGRKPSNNYRTNPQQPVYSYPDTGQIYRPPSKAQLITNSYIQQHPVNTGRYTGQQQSIRYVRPQQQQQRPATTAQQINTPIGEGQPGQFISFPLPGNGAHFYFLTPQVIKKQEQDRYVYVEPNQRLRRSRYRHNNSRDEQIYTNRRK